MLDLSGKKRLIDADDLVELLEEKRREVVGYESWTIKQVIELVKAQPSISYHKDLVRLP